jgi:hypothetical protein
MSFSFLSNIQNIGASQNLSLISILKLLFSSLKLYL